jgi:hypothetical protein
MYDTWYGFGDSHAEIFIPIFPKRLFHYPASSAKGLGNSHSTNGTNQKILDTLSKIPEGSNIIFYFGKVDIDFILNYKYNTSDMTEFDSYIKNTVQAYIDFIHKNTEKYRVWICELPLSHLNDQELLKCIQLEAHLKYINTHLSSEDKHTYVKYTKVIPFEKRNEYTLLFNAELQRYAESYSYKVLEINKYFRNEDGSYTIPKEYHLNGVNHHLNSKTSQLFLRGMPCPEDT